ncbi:hypothetical protein ATN81_02310 [Agrobacterium pusense]|nr:hypothetical protein ATN81_02310 [Agrobacterium pusense]
MGKPKRIRDLQGCSGSWIAASRQNVDDNRGRADAVIERFLAGSLNGGETIGGNASEYGDHLPITVIDALQSLADLLHCGWQNPFAEGSAVAQGTGFASKDRDIVPGIIDGIATAKAAPMFSDRREGGGTQQGYQHDSQDLAVDHEAEDDQNRGQSKQCADDRRLQEAICNLATCKVAEDEATAKDQQDRRDRCLAIARRLG